MLHWFFEMNFHGFWKPYYHFLQCSQLQWRPRSFCNILCPIHSIETAEKHSKTWKLESSPSSHVLNETVQPLVIVVQAHFGWAEGLLVTTSMLNLLKNSTEVWVVGTARARSCNFLVMLTCWLLIYLLNNYARQQSVSPHTLGHAAPAATLPHSLLLTINPPLLSARSISTNHPSGLNKGW